ncbi:MAG: hypothetical protein JO022_17715 [Acidobacteriaceae bacterium]|nr:hypothetical protein [Acidobacteriaceae bacterium]
MGRFRSVATFFVLALPCAAQFMTTLQPRSVDEFDTYAHSVEAALEQRWQSKQPFLLLDEDPVQRAQVLGGDVWIQAGNAHNPITIYDGLVHDWVGAVFMRHTDVKKVLDILQDFNRHSRIYPDVKQSRTVRRSGEHVTGFWRLERKQSLVSAVLEVTQDAEWQQVAPGKWACRAYAKNIQELEHPGTPQEKALPLGQGRGFLWRLYAYWSLESVNGGVLGECRTLSLSRSIPPGVAWAIQPFVEILPRSALASTLTNTRAAAEQ